MLSWQIFKKFLFSPRSGSLIRTISRLCILGIGIGVFSLVLVNSIMNGFHQAIRQRLLNVEPHVVVYFKKGEGRDKEERLLKDLNSRQGVEAHIFEEQDVMIRTSEGTFSGGIAVGMDREPLLKVLKNLEIENPEALLGQEIPGKTNQLGRVFVGKDLAYTLGVYEKDEVVVVPPESLLTPTGEIPVFDQAMVSAILSTSVADVDAKNIFYVRDESLKRLKNSSSWKEGIEIRLNEPMTYLPLVNELRANGWLAESWVDRNSTLFFALKIEKTIIAVFLALSTLIASFSIVTVLTILFTQKRKEFGILMALGISLRRTRIIFSNVGLILAGIGLGVGLVLGTIISLILERWPLDILPKEIYYDTRITAEVDFLVILIVALGSIFIAFFSAWTASTQVLATNPVESLR